MEEKSGLRYRSLFWPILLIGIGTIWLLASLGVLHDLSWRFLLRLWPLILIVIGLDIIFGRRSPLIGALIGLVAVALVVVLVLLAPSLNLEPEVELKTLNFSETLDGTTSARIDLDLERYPTTVDALTDSALLIDAKLETLTNVDFSVSGTNKKSVTLNPRRDSSTDFSWFDLLDQDARWEIGLSPNVPIDLTINIGSGSAELRLGNLELTSLKIDGGSGSVNGVLPASSSQYDLRIDGGSGSFDIELESGTNAMAFLEIGSGSFEVMIGAGSDVSAEIHGGSGSIGIDVPDDVGVRIVVEERGSGSVSVPSKYDLVDDMNDDDGDTGIWESEGYSGAAHRIEITFEPGSGSFNVR